MINVIPVVIGFCRINRSHRWVISDGHHVSFNIWIPDHVYVMGSLVRVAEERSRMLKNEKYNRFQLNILKEYNFPTYQCVISLVTRHGRAGFLYNNFINYNDHVCYVPCMAR